MTNRKDLIDSFVLGADSGSGGSNHTGTPSLSIQGDELRSYSTVIAKRLPGKRMWLSTVRYSKTTTVQQNLVRGACQRYGVTLEESDTMPLVAG